jgi:hypothetical protein
MNPFWKQIIINNTVFHKNYNKHYSSLQLAKSFRRFKIVVTRLLKFKCGCRNERVKDTQGGMIQKRPLKTLTYITHIFGSRRLLRI